MKKILIFTFAIAICLLQIFIAPNSKFAFAESLPSESISFDKQQFVSDATSFLNEFKDYTSRIAGTDGEKDAASYIVNKFNELNLTAKNNDDTKNGIQNFGFISTITGLYSYSQNIIFNYNGSADEKKLIIGCNYDAVAFELEQGYLTNKIAESESIISSAANVAVVYAIASAVQQSSLNINIEFVLFGAGESNCEGSNFYVQGLLENDKKNIIGMINIDSVVGENIYFYSEEVSNNVTKYLNDFSAKNNFSISSLNIKNVGKIILSKPNDLGLMYSHIAMSSDNYNFMKNGIKCVSIIAGDYSTGLMVGRNEFSGGKTVSYTANDNLEYIAENFGNVVEENISAVGEFVFDAISNSAFITAFNESAAQNNWFYLLFGNRNLAVFIAVFALIIFVVLANFLHYKFTVKAYHANIETEFLTSVIKISEQIESEGSEESVAKIVSKVLAEDIKRDKTIKAKKRKDKDK